MLDPSPCGGIDVKRSKRILTSWGASECVIVLPLQKSFRAPQGPVTNRPQTFDFPEKVAVRSLPQTLQGRGGGGPDREIFRKHN